MEVYWNYVWSKDNKWFLEFCDRSVNCSFQGQNRWEFIVFYQCICSGLWINYEFTRQRYISTPTIISGWCMLFLSRSTFGSTKYVANFQGNYQQAYCLTCHPLADTRWSIKIHQMETSPTARSRSRSNSRTKTSLMATLEATLLVSFAVDVFKFTNFCSSLTYFLFSLFIPRSWRLRRSRWRWWWWIWSLLDFKYAVWWNLREANWYSAAR